MPFHISQTLLLCIIYSVLISKNYQMIMSEKFGFGYGSWYNEERVYTYNSHTADGGESNWSGTLVGVAEYDRMIANTALHANSKIVLKLESGTDTDYYIGFNRAVGINSDNVDYDDHVTVIEAGGQGVTYSQSYLKATLLGGDEYVVSDNWRGTGEKMVVIVDEIKLDVVPGYATVRVQLGEEEDGGGKGGLGGGNTLVPKGTSQPTKLPTSQPTNQPTPVVRRSFVMLVHISLS